VLNGLAGKVAIVTGGAGGLGSATARRLSDEGCRVLVVDVDGNGARKVAESLPSLRGSAWDFGSLDRRTY
jgi:NAD(P)-dependent dehydrogenase (short-subunit alcohol dehydrogenase family)